MCYLFTTVVCERYEEEEADGTDSTVYSTAVALAIMGCFQVRKASDGLTPCVSLCVLLCSLDTARLYRKNMSPWRQKITVSIATIMP